MKHLRETFTEDEFKQLKIAKNNLGQNWHDFIMNLKVNVITGYDDDNSESVMPEILKCPKCNHRFVGPVYPRC
jgi:hypothetical protein